MNFGAYSSGQASRLIKFYEKNNPSDYPLRLLIYDGDSKLVYNKLVRLSTPHYAIHYQKESCAFSAFTLDALNKYEIDYLFCFGMKIFKGKILESYQNKIINFHPSLLPRFPGINAIDQALNTNSPTLGNTAHFITDKLDSGEIILQSEISRSEYIDYDSVLDLQLNMLSTIWNELKSK